MKRIASLCLVLALLMGLSITAFAADESGVGVGNYNTSVTGSTVNGSTDSATVFSVDITWTGMDFTYHGAQAPVWDAENHTYTEGAKAHWEGNGAIKVTNDSNTGITATPSYTATVGYEDADMVFNTDKLCVGTAEYGQQTEGSISVAPTGSLPNDTQDKVIGTITITIAENTEIAQEDIKALSNAASQLVSDMESSELYASNEELRTKTESLNHTHTYIDELYLNAVMGTWSQGEINNKYAGYRSNYYETKAYFDALKKA